MTEVLFVCTGSTFRSLTAEQAAGDSHVRATIDRILSLTPQLAARLDSLLKS